MAFKTAAPASTRPAASREPTLLNRPTGFAAAAIDERRYAPYAAGQIIFQLFRVESKHVPAALFHEVVAGIVVKCSRGIKVKHAIGVVAAATN